MSTKHLLLVLCWLSFWSLQSVNMLVHGLMTKQATKRKLLSPLGMPSSDGHILAVFGGCGLEQSTLALPVPLFVFKSSKAEAMIDMDMDLKPSR